MNLPAETLHPLMWVLFALTYMGIAFGRFPWLVLDRTGIAVLGAIAMLVVRGVSVDEAAHFIDKPTMLLLFGLMIFSAQLRVAGFHVIVGQWLARLIARPHVLLAAIIAVSAVVSALLANDIVCLAFTPMICAAVLKAGRNPIPYLLALATSSNVGSAATIIGNPQNMYIGSVAGLHFGRFAIVMLPPVIVGLALCWVAVVLLFKRELAFVDGASDATASADSHENETLIPSSLPLQTHDPEIDRYLIGKTLLLLVVLVIVFLLAGPSGNKRAVAALAGAGVLLCSHRAKAARLYQLVDWNLLLLFLGLFVVNGAMQEQRLTERVFAAVASHGMDFQNTFTLSAITTVLSNLISNVPAVLLLQQPVAAAKSEKVWYVLALVSTWAGNLTLVGSIANLIVAESAAAYGVKLDLKIYCRVGIPLTLVTVVIGTLWLTFVM